MSREERERAFDVFINNTPWEHDLAVHPAHHETPLECVIIEPRECQRLIAVICNISAMLPGAAITVFHSAENAHMIEDVRAAAPAGIRFIEFTKGNITRDEYSRLLTSVEFWDQLIAPKILIFQTDSAMRYNDILRYMKYDSIGAPWNWTVADDARVEIGNGGFCLRSRAMCREICARAERAPEEAEDIFFARHFIDIPGVHLPDKTTAAEFSFEHAYIPAEGLPRGPMAFHQAYLHQPLEVVAKLFTEGVDLGGASKNKIVDAWIEEPNGHIIREIIIAGEAWSLTAFLGLGLTAKGLALSPGVDFGASKGAILYIQFDEENVKIRL